MSIQLMNRVWNMAMPCSEKMVLMSMADQANDAGRSCFPGLTSMAFRSGLDIRSVRRILRKLEAEGHITTKLRTGTSSVYHVHPNDKATRKKRETALTEQQGSAILPAVTDGDDGGQNDLAPDQENPTPDKMSGVNGLEGRPECPGGRTHGPPNHHLTTKKEEEEEQGAARARPLVANDDAREAQPALHADWWPSEAMMARLIVEFPTVDVNTETLQFRDKNLAKGTDIADITAALRAWLRTAIRLNAKRARADKGSAVADSIDALRARGARLDHADAQRPAGLRPGNGSSQH